MASSVDNVNVKDAIIKSDTVFFYLKSIKPICTVGIASITEQDPTSCGSLTGQHDYHSLSLQSKYIDKYVRHTSNGADDIVLTPESPRFIKFYLDDGRILATYNGRIWGFVPQHHSIELQSHDGAALEVHGSTERAATNEGPHEHLRNIQMFENEGSRGFHFEHRKDVDGREMEVLTWRSDDSSGNHNDNWQAWVLRDSPPDRYKGYPQLFWLAKAEVPEDCIQVDLVREPCC